MRRLSLFLCALCCVMGLVMMGKEEKIPEAETAAPSVQTVSAKATPEAARILVEEAAVIEHMAEETAEPVLLQVFRDGEVVTVEMEEYLVHVVAGEMPASYEPEALRAQAVAARSYIAWKMPAYGGGGCSRGAGADVCTDSTHCMAYRSEEEMRADWGERYEEYHEKIAQAVAATAGEVMLYEGSPIQALFHASSPGRTEDAQAVWGTALPYLTSVTSGEAEEKEVRRYAADELARTLNKAFDGAGLTADNLKTQFIVRSRTDSGRADVVRVGKVTATGRAVRSALGLDSACFAIAWEKDTAVITTQGYGHGVGMSQVGANVMAQDGVGYREILTHYYTGVEIGGLP